MNKWFQQYRDHTVWSTLERLVTLVDGIELHPGEETERASYLKSVLRMMSEYRESPSYLVTPPLLNELETNLTGNVESYLISWVNQNNFSYLESAITQLYTAIDVMRGWPLSEEQTNRSLYGNMQAITKSALAIPEQLEQSISRTKSELQAALDEVTASAAATQQEFDEQYAELKDNLAQMQGDVEAVNDHVTGIEAEIKLVSTTQTSEYTKAETARGQQFVNLLAEERQEFEDTVQDALTANAKTMSDQENAAQAIIDRLGDVKSEAEKTVGAIAGKTTAAWYQRYADEQKIIADDWRKYSTWILLGGAAATLVWFIITAWNGETFEEAMVKVVVSLSLILAAGYCSKQSSHHRDQEVRARSIELKLQALDPFMATVNPTDRERMKLATAFDVFLDPETDTKKQPLPSLSEVRSPGSRQVLAEDNLDGEA